MARTLGFVALTIRFGFTVGPLLTAALVASYPILLILAPIRNRLVPREVGASPSPVPLRVWAVGWLPGRCRNCLLSALPHGPLRQLPPLLLPFLPLVRDSSLGHVLRPEGSGLVQWRNRPRKKVRKAPQDGKRCADGSSDLRLALRRDPLETPLVSTTIR